MMYNVKVIGIIPSNVTQTDHVCVEHLTVEI